MSNGLYTKVQELIRGGEFPQEVSNDLILAAVLDNTKHTRENTKSIAVNAKAIDENATQIKVAKAADKKWSSITVAIAAAISFLRPGG